MRQVTDLVSLERDIAVEDGVETDACRPYVDWEALVADFLDDLWRDVGWGAALLKQELVLVNAPRNTEISDFDVAVAIQEDIVELDVSVDNANGMHVGNTLHNLLEQILSVFLCQLTPFAHIVQEVAAWAELHYNQVMFGRLESFKQFYVADVLDRLQNVDFLHHFAFCALFFDLVLVGRLNGDKFPGKAMEA